jgi:hypothetical protein
VTTKVSRDGTIMQDGKPIGRVEKVMRQGVFATILGASYSTEGTPYWIPYGADGKALNEYGYDTRKRAVALVEAHAQPLAVSDIKVESSFFGGRPFVSAWVKFQGYSFGVSRYANESQWVVDCLFTPGTMMPTFSNGAGTRFTKARVLKPEMAEAATKAATEAGVWPLPEEIA